MPMCEAICAMFLCSLVCLWVGESVNDASECMCNLRFRWWCRRVCKYVSGICYQGNRHSPSRCNGIAGAVLQEAVSIATQHRSCLYKSLCVHVCVWIRWEMCEFVFISVPRYDLLCNISYFFILAMVFHRFRRIWCPTYISYIALFLPSPFCPPRPRVSLAPCLWLLKLIRVNRCCGCYLCFHLVWLSYKLSTGPAQCSRSV